MINLHCTDTGKCPSLPLEQQTWSGLPWELRCPQTKRLLHAREDKHRVLIELEVNLGTDN